MQAKVILALVLCVLWFVAGWTISGWYNDAGHANTLKAALKQQKEDMQVANKASIELERAKAITEAKTKTITKRVEVYLEGKPAAECFDAEALKIFNELS